jgi:hypothetical protein
VRIFLYLISMYIFAQTALIYYHLLSSAFICCQFAQICAGRAPVCPRAHYEQIQGACHEVSPSSTWSRLIYGTSAFFHDPMYSTVS